MDKLAKTLRGMYGAQTEHVPYGEGYSRDREISWLAERINYKLTSENTASELHRAANKAKDARMATSPRQFVRLKDFSRHCEELVISAMDSSAADVGGRVGDRKGSGCGATRRAIRDLQALWVTAAKTETQLHAELRSILTCALFSLSWAGGTLSVLLPVFFVSKDETDGGNPSLSGRDGFQAYLTHWAGTGLLQCLFEVLVLTLVRERRFDAVLTLLACAELPEARTLLSPLLRQDSESVECRSEIVAGLRFPLVAVEELFHCTRQQNGSGQRQDKACLPLLALIICQKFSNQLFIHRKGHRQLLQGVSGEEAAFEEEGIHVTPFDDHSEASANFWLKAMASTKLRRDFANEDRFLERVAQQILDAAVASYVFRDDPGLQPTLVKLRNWHQAGDWHGLATHRSLLLALPWTKIQPSDKPGGSSTRVFEILELCGRLVENYWVVDAEYNPTRKLLLTGSTGREEKQLQMAKKVVVSLTGCQVGRLDLLFMRLLENFEKQNDRQNFESDLVGVDVINACPLPFQPVLNLSEGLLTSLILPVAAMLPQMKAAILKPSPLMPNYREARLASFPPTETEPEELFQPHLPTLLPEFIAQVFPSILAGRALPIAGNVGGSLEGWKVLHLEMLAAATGPGEELGQPPGHMSIKLVALLLPLYVDARCPRAARLLCRFLTVNDRERRENAHFLDNLYEFFDSLMLRAQRSKFVFFADAMERVVAGNHSFDSFRKILNIYLAAEDFTKARKYLEANDAMRARLAPEIVRAVIKGGDLAAGSEENKKNRREERVRQALDAIKKMAAARDVDAVVSFFYRVRASDCISDISLVNKILHLCVSSHRWKDAVGIFNHLRAEAHEDLNGVDFFPCGTTSVRPDVVTCNIMLKGLVRSMGNSPGGFNSVLVKRYIRAMETPFWQGGEGVKPDPITYNVVIGAAASQKAVEPAWEFFRLMRSAGIRTDAYTCNLLIAQLDLEKHRHIAEALVPILDELDPASSPTGDFSFFLVSLIDAYAKLGELRKLESLLERYEGSHAAERNLPASSLVALLRGYLLCQRLDKVKSLGRKIRESDSFRWNSALVGALVDIFSKAGDANSVAETVAAAMEHNVVLADSGGSGKAFLRASMMLETGGLVGARAE